MAVTECTTRCVVRTATLAPSGVLRARNLRCGTRGKIHWVHIAANASATCASVRSTRKIHHVNSLTRGRNTTALLLWCIAEADIALFLQRQYAGHCPQLATGLAHTHRTCTCGEQVSRPSCQARSPFSDREEKPSGYRHTYRGSRCSSDSISSIARGLGPAAPKSRCVTVHTLDLPLAVGGILTPLGVDCYACSLKSTTCTPVSMATMLELPPLLQ